MRQRSLILIATLLVGWLPSSRALAQEERLRLEGEVSDEPEGSDVPDASDDPEAIDKHEAEQRPEASGVPKVSSAPKPSDASKPNEPKRKVPNYDNRGGPHETPGQKALWVPRVLLSPLYFVSEFVIRRPLAFVISAAEEHQVPAAIYDFFAFGEGHSAGVIPIAYFDSGAHPSFGVYAFWDDVFFKGHDLRLRAMTGGADSLSVSLTERFKLAKEWDLTLSGGASRRPDYSFYGIGWDTRNDDLLRYAADTVDASLATRWHRGRSLAEFSTGYESASFADTGYGDESVHDAIARGKIEAPPGYEEGFRAGVISGRLVLDSRSLGGSETGVRCDLRAEQGSDFKNSPTSSWIRYGGSVGGLWDPAGNGRVISLSLSTLFADPVGNRPVPFTELIQLGGSLLMSGLRSRRLTDSSGAVLTLRYTWPVWIWVNGSIQAAIGNVFGKHLEDFALDRTRFSGAIGIESHGSRDSVFQALVGVGTEPFVSGGEFNSVRFTIGARRGF